MVRVRYAPSPTGTLHIGGARTALFNYLFARHFGGHFVLRVEDTDQARLIRGSEAGMMAGLKSLGILWDEGPDVGGEYGPYRQSERTELYRPYIDQLLEKGQAYRCYCTPEELDAERSARLAQGLPPRYSGKCRLLSADDPIHTSGKPSVVRLKVPSEGTTVVHDLIRGDVSFENKVLDDFVIAKRDGSPVYNFAVVIDDHLMAMTHIIRGEEHLSNTPKQLLVYQALGWEPPLFAHVPMILAPDRSKL
ncbi:MAG: glutamate--tRNA ligase, partial [Firmicutes bacterium]|nr:glutamate--tRNA ligase [Bacillota bacterium]